MYPVPDSYCTCACTIHVCPLQSTVTCTCKTMCWTSPESLTLISGMCRPSCYANRLPMVSVFCYMWQRVHLNFFLYLSGMRYLHWKAPYNPVVHRDLHPLSGTSTIVTSLHAYTCTCTCSTFCPGVGLGQPSWAACIHVSSILLFSSLCLCVCARVCVCGCGCVHVRTRVHACVHV